MNIRWQRGTFLKFVSLMKIHVGGNTALDVQNGDEFEYDGSILKYSGMEVAQPQLRGAISSGWVKLISPSGESEDSSDLPDTISPNRNIAKAQTINRDLLKVQRTSGTKVVTSQQDEDEVLRVGDRGGNSPKVVTATDNRKSRSMSIRPDSNDDQGAVTIGRVKTSAKQMFSDVSRQDAGTILNELENMSSVKADLYHNTVEKEGVTIRSNIGNINRMEVAQEDDGEVIGHVRTATKISTEGIEVTDTSAPGKKQAAPSSVAPGAPVRDMKLSPRIRVAKAIYPEFPLDWSFEGKLAERLEAVRKHGVSPDFLEALYAAEGDQFRKVLIREYPDQFPG